MKLDVSNALMHPGQEYSFQGLQAIADQEITGETVAFDDCAVKGTFLADDEGNITIDGQVESLVHAHCALCLEETEKPVSAEFTETFIRGGDAEDDEIFAYEGHTVDLEKLVMSYIVMALPIRFLCREDCPGLAYGEPVSETESVEDPNIQYPFAGLKDLLNHDEEV